MPRPKSKPELIDQAQQRYAELLQEIEDLSEDDLCAPGVVGEWSIKDVLAHLAEWHRMCLGWYRAGAAGEVPKTPSERYTWKQTPQLNDEIWQKHRNDSLDRVKSELEGTHVETLDVIGQISNADLFESRPYAWTKSTTLGAYFVSATGSHYDWARKEIRRGLKKRQAQAG